TRFSRDWSSDVCSSDLLRDRHRPEVGLQAHLLGELDEDELVTAPAVAGGLDLRHGRHAGSSRSDNHFSSVPVWKSPAANHSSPRISACSPAVVGTPSTANSASARWERRIALSRSSPHTTTFASSES